MPGPAELLAPNPRVAVGIQRAATGAKPWRVVFTLADGRSYLVARYRTHEDAVLAIKTFSRDLSACDMAERANRVPVWPNERAHCCRA